MLPIAYFLKRAQQAVAEAPADVGESVADYLRLIARRAPAELSASLAAAEWERDVAGATDWILKTVSRQPIPDSCACVFVGVPDISLNEPVVRVWGRTSEDGDTVWEPEAEFSLDGLAVAREHGARAEQAGAGYVAETLDGLALVVVAGTLRKALHAVNARVRGEHERFRITYGFLDGDVYSLGDLTTAGIEPARPRSRQERQEQRRARQSDPDRVNPRSYGLDLDAYLDAGLDPNAKGFHNEPIIFRCSALNPRLMARLLHAGANPNAHNRRGLSVLACFGASGMRMPRILLDAGADPNAVCWGAPMLHHFARNGLCRAKHMRLLIKYGARPLARDAKGNNALHALADFGVCSRMFRARAEELTSFLVGVGVRINARNAAGQAPIWMSLGRWMGELDLRRRKPALFVLETPRVGGDAILEVASDSAYDAAAMVLLRNGADPNSRARTPVHRSLGPGATPLMTPRYGSGRLHRALLEAGADPRITCGKGMTAVDYAKRALKRAEKDADTLASFAGDPRARFIESQRYPEKPKVIASILQSMEDAVSRRGRHRSRPR